MHYRRPPTPSAATGSPTPCASSWPRTAPGPAGSSSEALADRGIALGAAAGPPPPEADEGRLPPHRLDAQAQAGPGQGRAGRPGPGQPQGEGGRRPAEALLPRRVRLLADAADRLQLDPAGRSGSSSAYEAPQGRRVNALAAYRPYGRSPRLEVFTAERTWDSYDLLGFLKALPWSKVPRVVVLDNASLHTSKVDPAGPAGPGRGGDLPVLPAAVQPGAERDRAGVPAGQVPGDPRSGATRPACPARRWRRASPATAGGSAKTSEKTTSGCLGLRFASLSQSNKVTLISRLTAALPEHSVFESGGYRDQIRITVMPVVVRSRVLERQRAVLLAVQD